MPRRVIVMVLAVLIVAGLGAIAYVYWTPQAVAAADDCQDKPAPKDEFAMAAECDAPAAPGQDPK
jgi:hypothetical protein